MTAIIDFALRYAGAGFPILPLKPRDKVPCTEHGAKDATTDESVIREWWARWPKANIGMTLDGLVVVDIDPRNGGDCNEWAAKLPETCYARTGGGGLHYLYRTVNGTRYRKLEGAAGIDIKTGRNSYIVVEPSVHPSGDQYNWLDETEPWTTKPTVAPEWLAVQEGGRGKNNADRNYFSADEATLRDLRSALTAIRSDERDEWVRIGLALKTLGEGGRSLWLEWSQTSEKFDAADAARVWDSLTPNSIGYEAVFATAQDLGWVNPAKRTRPEPDEPTQDASDWTTKVPPHEGSTDAPTGSTKRNVIDLRTWAGTEPPAFQWILPHWLSWHPTLLAAPGGMGKTLLLMMIGVALASGKPFLGPARERMRVLLWLCEDDEPEIHRRLARICEHFGVDMADLHGWLFIDARRGLENTLYSTEYGKPMWTSLIEELRQEVNDYKADTLVLDNIAQIFAANPNAAHDTTSFTNGVVGLGEGRAFAPILTGHTARSQGSEYSGSAAWENAMRMRWYLGDRLPDEKQAEDEQPDGNVRFLCKRKANYTAKDYVRFTFQNGVLVPEQLDDGASGIEHMLRQRKAQGVLIAAMRKFAEMGKTMSDTKGANYLPRLIMDYKYHDGLTRKELEDAMRSAQSAGKIRKQEIGRYDNRAAKTGLAVVEA